MNPTAHIRILKYRGKSGAYAREDSDRWRVSLVSDAGEVRLDSFMSEGCGYSSLSYAMETAAPYAKVLGLPVRHATEQQTVTREIQYTNQGEA